MDIVKNRDPAHLARYRGPVGRGSYPPVTGGGRRLIEQNAAGCIRSGIGYGGVGTGRRADGKKVLPLLTVCRNCRAGKSGEMDLRRRSASLPDIEPTQVSTTGVKPWGIWRPPTST
jgi:hypothetical protein